MINNILNNPDITKITIEKILLNSDYSKINYYEIKDNEGYVKKLLYHLLNNLNTENIQILRVAIFQNDEYVSYYTFDIIINDTEYLVDTNINTFINYKDFLETVEPIEEKKELKDNYKNMFNKLILYFPILFSFIK